MRVTAFTSQSVLSDTASKAAIGITYAHAAVHRDIIVRATKNFVAGTTPINILFKTSAGVEAHLEYLIQGAADCEVFLYEAPTVTGEGTNMTSARLLRSSTKEIQGVAKSGGTVSAKGTLINEGFNGGSGTGANVSGGAIVHEGAEWVTKADTWYLIEIVRPVSGKAHATLEWYEVPPIKL